MNVGFPFYSEELLAGYRVTAGNQTPSLPVPLNLRVQSVTRFRVVEAVSDSKRCCAWSYYVPGVRKMKFKGGGTCIFVGGERKITREKPTLSTPHRSSPVLRNYPGMEKGLNGEVGYWRAFQS
uniref:Uncharacterized protein n=1 Tax=Timema poppense TaxID=170557 RepID=A0A7R9H8D5_TIMPO|nr:unnamed protein product [Timema poppensis]